MLGDRKFRLHVWGVCTKSEAVNVTHIIEVHITSVFFDKDSVADARGAVVGGDDDEDMVGGGGRENGARGHDGWTLVGHDGCARLGHGGVVCGLQIRTLSVESDHER